MAVVLVTGCREPSYYGPRCTASLGDITATVENASGLAFLTLTKPGALYARGSLGKITVDQIALGQAGRRLFVCALSKDEGVSNSVHVYAVYRKVLVPVWKGVPKSLKAWKITAGDVDGDGRLDLGVGVYKKAKFHPVMAKRPFVYTWNGKAFVPKWLGSRLSRPFTDFVFADFPGGPKLVSIEDTQDGRHELAVYKWDGFGFTREWTGCRAEEMSGLTASGRVVGVDGTHRTYVWDGRGLKEVRR